MVALAGVDSPDTETVEGNSLVAHTDTVPWTFGPSLRLTGRDVNITDEARAIQRGLWRPH